MNGSVLETWEDYNQRYIAAALERVRTALESRAGNSDPTSDPMPELPDTNQKYEPPALETLCAVFGLSPFERDILLLCAGMELDSKFIGLCAKAQRDPKRPYPTFSLALATLPEPHWSAIVPTSPLRYWRLIEVGPGETLTKSPLHIDERVLHYLTGISYLDERLHGLLEPALASDQLPPSHRKIAERIVARWTCADDKTAVVQLCGEAEDRCHALAALACHEVGLDLQILKARSIPPAAADRETFVRLWEREAVLNNSALLLDCHGLGRADALPLITALMERLQAPLLVATSEPLSLPGRSFLRLDVSKPSPVEQRELWYQALGPRARRVNGELDALVTQFSMSPGEIAAATDTLLSEPEPSGDLHQQLWDTCRAQARARLGDLAQRIIPAAGWDDLVLPIAQHQTLHEIVAHVRQRGKVYEHWGFAARCNRGLGISALFVGASGTGKTMAADVLANELRLDLYRIDLSAVVSKYIGETEKNLRRVFDAAETSGAVLLFDEADALFGKRSEVKDSHDRYANIEVSYLLQRMESYRGLAILTTNMKQALDTAFFRRIRFIVQFPFPDADQRAEIWKRIFPVDTPTEGLSIERLAQLNVAGGNIRNIALSAAFLAADEGSPVRMHHLLQAAQSEYTKLERPLTGSEVGGWV